MLLCKSFFYCVLLRALYPIKKNCLQPTLKELEKKYEAAMKEKMLMRLERDRMAGKVETLEAQLKQFERQPTTTDDAPVLKPKKKKKGADVKVGSYLPPHISSLPQNLHPALFPFISDSSFVDSGGRARQSLLGRVI
jgi:hypothetical protein